nr:MAG TPA: hypothetical protein [Caudoviricetes sp.]
MRLVQFTTTYPRSLPYLSVVVWVGSASNSI